MIRHRRIASPLFTIGLCLLAACGGGDDNPTIPGGGGGGTHYPPPEAAEARATGDLVEARDGHTATLLQDGRVLVTGGWNGRDKKVSCEVYDPTAETWSLTSPMAEARFGHRATLLRDGRVLVTGGSGIHDTTLRSWQIYDPASGTWTDLKPYEHPYNESTGMRWGRDFHAATVLQSGDVLITGGFNTYATSWVGGDYLHTYDIFYTDIEQTDWREGRFPLMQSRRYWHGSTLLTAGRVLLSGGFNHQDQYMTACELYQADLDTFVTAGAMATPRVGHGSFLLDDGRVFVCGGSTTVTSFTRSCEIYDPAADAWSAAPSMRQLRNRPSFVQFSDGRIAAAGNIFESSTEICTPGGPWSFHHDLLERRHLFSMTVFANDVALVAGGVDETAPGNGGFLTSCELYVP